MSPFDAFVGIPYATRGRDRNGIDCWGLVRLVFAELRSIDLPSLADDYVGDADRQSLADLIADRLPVWDQVEPRCEQPFDGVLMRAGRECCHIGVVVTPGRVLHVEDKRSSCIDRYGDWRLAHRIAGFYRYRLP